MKSKVLKSLLRLFRSYLWRLNKYVIKQKEDNHSILVKAEAINAIDEEYYKFCIEECERCGDCSHLWLDDCLLSLSDRVYKIKIALDGLDRAEDTGYGGRIPEYYRSVKGHYHKIFNTSQGIIDKGMLRRIKYYFYVSGGRLLDKKLVGWERGWSSNTLGDFFLFFLKFFK
jgi:hypothetical protein